MELTSMFLNLLTNKTNSNMVGANKLQNGSFNEYFNKAETKFNNQNENTSYKKDNSYKTKDKSYTNKKDFYEKVENKQDFKVEDDKAIDDEMEGKDKAIVIDEDTLNKLSDVLGIPKENIMDILANLSMSVSMLQQPEHLIQFLQSAFNTKSPADLLAINNIKDIMSGITDIAKNIGYEDIIPVDENMQNKLNQLMNQNNLKDVSLLSDNKDIKERIDELLSQLNGSVQESTVKKLGVNIEAESAEELVNIDEIKNVNLDNKSGYYQGENQNNMSNNQNSLLGENLKQNNLEANVKQEVFNISEITNNSKIFNTSLPKTQALRNINNTEIINQIMEKIKVSIKPEISEVKMLLKPEQLGEVTLKIATQNGIVTAQFIAESQKIKEVIEANFNQLRDMLSEQGINVGALEVNVSDSDEQQPKYNMFEQSTEKTEKRINDLLEKSFEEEEKQQKQVKEEHIIDSQVNYSI